MEICTYEGVLDNWDEVRTALQVAREGTVSGAANRMGVHHATVIRHVDALEQRLGVKLFQRHARGYTPTEAGEDLMRVGQATEDQFQALEGKLRGKGDEVSGDLVITTLTTIANDLVPVIADFQCQYPDVTVRIVTGERLFRLEYGEAHVAIRAGTAPQEPDNVVQKYREYQLGLYASQDYVAKHGLPENLDDFAKHRFVTRQDMPSRAPFIQWQAANIPQSSIRFASTDDISMNLAIRSGIGIGFLEVDTAEQSGLVQMWEPLDEWMVHLWLVTHVDLHRTAKVQAFLRHLKQFHAE